MFHFLMFVCSGHSSSPRTLQRNHPIRHPKGVYTFQKAVGRKVHLSSLKIKTGWIKIICFLIFVLFRLHSFCLSCWYLFIFVKAQMVTDSVAKLPVEEKKQQQQQQGDKPLILPLPPKPALVPKPSTGQLATATPDGLGVFILFIFSFQQFFFLTLNQISFFFIWCHKVKKLF